MAMLGNGMFERLVSSGAAGLLEDARNTGYD
jgi:hypothetical protein